MDSAQKKKITQELKMLYKKDRVLASKVAAALKYWITAAPNAQDVINFIKKTLNQVLRTVPSMMNEIYGLGKWPGESNDLFSKIVIAMNSFLIELKDAKHREKL